MQVFPSILLVLFLLCCSTYARFDSRRYLAMEQEKLRNGLAKEYNWNSKFSHAKANEFSETQQNCEYVVPHIGYGVEVPTAIAVCNVGKGAVCHLTQMFECCDNKHRGDEFKAGGLTLYLGTKVEMLFFYSGGGYGSRQPLGVCFTIDGSAGVCGRDLLGYSSNPSCGPSVDICEGNIIEGTCNPDPDPARGGGCTCQRGYLAPNCCLCDFPDFYERRSGAGQSTCEKLCRENCDGAPTRFGCSRCQQGYQGTGCCECAPGYTKVGETCEQSATGERNARIELSTCNRCPDYFINVGMECRGVCIFNCENGSYNPTRGCGKCKKGHGDPPLCCNCSPPPPPPSKRPRQPLFSSDCDGNEDLVFLLDYSTSFQPQDLRGILGNLQLISNALNSHPNIRDAVIHYRIRPRRSNQDENNTPSGYIYNYDSTCKSTVDQLDKFAGRNFMDNNRSFRTESYTALDFVARELPFTSGRRTSVITITDGFSSADDRISYIQSNITKIKRRASEANARVQFFSIGIKSLEDEDITKIEAELTALADGVKRSNFYVDYAHFRDNLLGLLVDANILCPSDRDAIVETLTKNGGSALSNYIECADQHSNEMSCGTQLNITCSNVTMGGGETGKSSLMTEILAAVKSVFNDALKNRVMTAK